MKQQLIATGLFACAILTTACSPTPTAAPAPVIDTAAEAKSLRDLEDNWNKDYEAKDTAKILAHYADDATLMGPGMPVSKGAAAIQKEIQEMVKDPALSLKFQASRVEVAKSGDVGFTEGTYTMTMTNPATKKPMTDTGSYVTVYKKQADGSWKAVSDIATSGPPSAPAKK